MTAYIEDKARPRELLIDAVVLAAGGATRFGGGKLLAPFASGTVLSAALGSAMASPARTVRVVVGCGAEAVEGESRRAAAHLGQSGRLAIITAGAWADGMSASLRAGVAALASDVEATYVFLGDMPLIPTFIFEPLADAVRNGAQAACPVQGGVRGHPALIGRSLFSGLLKLEGDQGARQVLDRLGSGLVLIPAGDPGVLQDVDTPSDLRALAGVPA